MKIVAVFIVSLIGGMKTGFEWYVLQCKRNKWNIIPFILDIITIPLKMVIVPILMMFEKTRNGMIKDYKEVKIEIEESKEF